MKIFIIGGSGTIGRKVVSYFKENHEVVTGGRNSGDIQIDIEDSKSIEDALASIDKELYKKEFELPANLEPMIAIAIGKSVENIKIVEPKDGDTNYYREDDSTHCVPKRLIEEILSKVYK